MSSIPLDKSRRRIIISDYTYEQITKPKNTEDKSNTLIERDHIGSAYFGEFGNRESTEKVRNRIYWMASEIAGETALDIGCSEGILPVLAAREGISIIGIDINEGAIEYAKQLLEKEQEAVRERCKFRTCELASIIKDDKTFDTVLAGEIIEHVVSPRKFFEQCLGRLNEGGKLIITTPFGINSDPGHKQTFFPSDLAKLASGHCDIEHISVQDGIIRFVGRKNPQSKEYDQAELLTITQDGAFAAQLQAQNLLDERRRIIFQQEAELQQSNQLAKNAIEVKSQLEADLAEATRKTVDLDNGLSDAIRENAALKADHAEATRKTVDLDNSLSDAIRENAALKADLAEATRKTVDLDNGLSDAIRENAALKADLEKNARATTDLNDKLIKMEELQKTLEGDLTVANTEAIRLETALQEAVNNTAALDGTISEVSKDKTVLESQLRESIDLKSALENELNELKIQHEQKNKDYNALNIECAGARKQQEAFPSSEIRAAAQQFSVVLNRQSDTTAALIDLKKPITVDETIAPQDPKARGVSQVRLDKRGITYRLKVEPTCRYDIAVKFMVEVPASKHEAIALIRYLDKNNTELAPPYPNTVLSDTVGPYRYLNPDELKGRSWCASLRAPEKAAYLEITVALWQPAKRRKIMVSPELHVVSNQHAIDRSEDLYKNLQLETSRLSSLLNGLLAKSNHIASSRQHQAAPFSDTKNTESANIPSQSANTFKERGTDTTQTKNQATTNKTPTLSASDLPSPPLFKGQLNKVISSPIKALSILDEMSEHNWQGAFDLKRLERSHFTEQLHQTDSDFVFLESCWNGNDGDWQYAFTSPELKHANAQQLLSAIAVAKKAGKKIVFWNKEDPMHYEKYLPIAKRSNVIFTTDSNKVSQYVKDTGIPTDVLPFAANPRICNPAGRFKKEPESVCFAGAYYSEGHEERNRQMDYMLPAIISHSGAIYDRYSKLKNPRYAFPEQYSPYLRDSVPFSKVVDIYKKFRVFLNVNTIIDSPTMMSRRVYELLASGTPVVSAPSAAIEAQFDGIVQTASTQSEADEKVGKLLTDSTHWNRVSHLGYREVLTKHDYDIRAQQLSTHARLGRPGADKPLVSIVIASCRAKNTTRMIENISRQNYPNLEVICALTPDFTAHDKTNLEAAAQASPNIKRIKILTFGNEVTLGKCLNEAIKVSKGEFIAKCDDDNFYFEHYISDLMLPFKIGDYDIVGKESYFCYLGGSDKLIWRFPDNRHKETQFVAGDAMIMRRRVFENTSFPEKRVGEDTKLLKDVRALGGKIYSADHYNFIKYRDGDLSNHTWRETEDKLMRRSLIIAQGLALDATKC